MINYICSMNIVEVNKVLSNKVRLDILKWLKTPKEYFPPHKELKHFNDGVCVQYIQEKAGLSQSTISHYLSLMQKVKLVIPKRHGKWTYYKRNEDTIKKYLELLDKEL